MQYTDAMTVEGFVVELDAPLDGRDSRHQVIVRVTETGLRIGINFRAGEPADKVVLAFVDFLQSAHSRRRADCVR